MIVIIRTDRLGMAEAVNLPDSLRLQWLDLGTSLNYPSMFLLRFPVESRSRFLSWFRGPITRKVTPI